MSYPQIGDVLTDRIQEVRVEAKRTTTSWGAPLPEGAEAGVDWWCVPVESDIEGVQVPPGAADDGCDAEFRQWRCTRHPKGTRHQATEWTWTRVVAEWDTPAEQDVNAILAMQVQDIRRARVKALARINKEAQR